MKRWVDEHLTRWIAGWVDFARRHARRVAAIDGAITIALAVLVVPRLGVNMDHKRLLDPNLPFQHAAAKFARYFPTMDDAMLIVIDAATPEMARTAAAQLADRLRQNTEGFRDVYVPGGGSFFQQHGLLYRSPEELDDFVDHLAQLQPILAELSQEPSIANLASLVRLGLERERAEGKTAADWPAVLNHIADATVHVFDEYPIAISWESLMVEGSALDEGTRQVVVVEPVLDFEKLLVAKRAIADIRAAARELSLLPERGVRVRITGNPALNYDEMLGLAWDVGFSSIFSFALVVGVLWLALRSLRLVVAAALTLVTGLIWTLAFAALAIGELNVLSITCGVMSIGMGIDFAIHLGMQYVAAARTGASGSAALRAAAEEAGSSLAICAVTSMVGLYAFTAAPYRGVAELGVISGTGMAIILLQTLTCFPALVTILLGEEVSARLRPALGFRLAPPKIVGSHPLQLTLAAAVLGVGAVVLLPRIYFDSNVVEMRDPRTESVQAFKDLLARGRTSPWSINVVAPTLAEAEQEAQRLRGLDGVEHALTLGDFVPEQQEEKIEILSDAALILETPNAPAEARVPMPVAEQVQALRDLHAELDADWLRASEAPLASAARRLRDELGRFLERVERDGDAAQALADFERLLLGSFPQQLQRLRLALRPSPITLEDLPKDLSSRMLAADGHARVQIFPRERLADTVSLQRFVDAVRGVEPDATGVAVNIVEFGRATVASLQHALFFALLGITLTVYGLFRRLGETVLVLMPALFAALLTGASMVLLNLPFNFVNVVVLPLLLGAGVDSGIHLVHGARSGPGTLLESTTARAVFYSAATSMASFASLVPSGHRGIFTLGTLLVVGMIFMLMSNLILLPALIELCWRRRR